MLLLNYIFVVNLLNYDPSELIMSVLTGPIILLFELKGNT